MIRYAAQGWQTGYGGPASIVTGDEYGDGYSCSLYHMPHVEANVEIFRQTVARLPGVAPVIPWVALGAGFRHRRDVSDGWEWRPHLLYGTFADWQLGRFLNMPEYCVAPYKWHGPDWNRATFVALYPGVMCHNTPPARLNAVTHFLAYCRGAAGLPYEGDVSEDADD